MPQQSLQRQRLVYLCDNLLSAVAAAMLQKPYSADVLEATIQTLD